LPQGLVEGKGVRTMVTDPMELEELIRKQQAAILELQAENAQLRSENGALKGENEELRGQVAELRQLVHELEAKLRDQGPPSGQAVPGFVKPNRHKAAKEGPRKKRGQGFGRRREEPTQRVVHAAEVCSRCGCGLRGGSVNRTRQVLHNPVAPVQVIEHVYLERRCPVCGTRNVPRVDLGEVVGQHRVSAQTMAKVATLREVGRLPVEAIQWLLETFHGLKLSLGEIVEILHEVRRQAQGVTNRILEELKASPVVHGDETSWREGGQNGYLWSFSSPTLRYFEFRHSRSGEIVTEVLGDDYQGVLVSDFYGGYNRMLGNHQRCWVHLLRDVHELKEKWPEHEGLLEWAEGVEGIYHRA
jgi:transposase